MIKNILLTFLIVMALINHEQAQDAIIMREEGKGSILPEDKKSSIALIVAISQYDQKTGWPTLNAQNDVPLIKYALLQQGFDERDITVIQNEQATKSGILKAIETQLIEKAQKERCGFPLFGAWPASMGHQRR
ncbi:MAG: hypothetical protein IPM82_28060 [Saprospiraceae bacterium]|nr:hypothetical protein [Saprospiraceae bacterium]